MTKEAEIPEFTHQNLIKLGEIPNTPYLYGPAKKVVEGRLQELGFLDYQPESHKEQEGFFVTADELAIYSRIRRGNPEHSLVITSHLDHPGFVVKNSQEGLALGSVGKLRLRELSQKEGIPLRIYSYQGELITDSARISRISKNLTKPTVTLESPEKISPNSHGVFDLPFVSVEDGKIRMLAADNVACTTAILQAIKTIVEDESQFSNIDLIVIFPYIEEIKQISVTGIAKRKQTPFGELEQKTIYISLEAMESEIDDSQRALLEKMGLPEPNYQDGLLIKTTDSGLVFGQAYPSARNLAEELLLNAAEAEKIRIQHTISSGTSEGTPLTLFEISSNLATLVIPNRYKHNLGDKGEIVPEEIKIRDLISAIKILTKTAKLTGEKILSPEKTLSNRLRRSSLIADTKRIRRMKREREVLLTASLPRLRTAHFYPASLQEELIVDFHRALAKIQSIIG